MPLGIIAGIVSGASAIAGASAARKSSKAQRRQNELQRKVNRLKNAQAKRAFLRNFRQQQAAILQSSVAMGVGLASSAVQGQVQSARSQKATAQAEFGKMRLWGEQGADAMNDISKYQGQAAMFGAVSSFASQFISFGGGGGSGGGGGGGGSGGSGGIA
jgi:hypothetical protein